MPFRWLEDVAIADIAFEATGRTLEEIFEQAALALEDAMVDFGTVKEKVEKKIEISGDRIEMLLYDFLSELIFLKDAEGLLFKGFRIKIEAAKGKYYLEALSKGEKIDRKSHGLRNDVKAVTMHMFEVRQEKEGWKATVVLDI